MNSKLAAVIGALAVLAVIVVVVLISQGGGEDNTDLSKEPVIEAGSGDPPTELQTNDIVVGDGAEAKPGDTLSVQYSGALYDTGEVFDTSWDDKQPLDFPLGAGQVIPGWDQGLAGMKEGGRRELIIPSDLAYGAAGSPPSIPPDSALIFIVDLEKVSLGAGAGPTAVPGATGGAPGSTQVVPSG
jgi:peptidylprolyl isomerase